MTGKFEDLSLYTDAELAAWSLAGYTGNGPARKAFLGYRYSAVQDIVNEVLKTGVCPPSGTDLDVLEDAVRTVYADAAGEIIKLIRKEEHNDDRSDTETR